MQSPLYTFKGEHTGTIELPDAVFNVKPNHVLLHEMVIAYQASSRQSVAHTKNRGEVRGGGKKPWKQKGTGRARHGSSRSPIWVGGGVTFGPQRNRDFTIKINRKAARKALMMALSDRAQSHDLVVVDAYTMPGPKTKYCADFIKKMCAENRSLVITAGAHASPDVVRCFKNIPKVEVISATDVNVVQVLRAKKLVVSSEGIAKLGERLASK